MVLRGARVSFDEPNQRLNPNSTIKCLILFNDNPSVRQTERTSNNATVWRHVWIDRAKNVDILDAVRGPHLFGVRFYVLPNDLSNL